MKQYEQDIAYIHRLIDEYEVIQKYLARRKKDRPNYWYILYHQKSDQDKVHYETSYSKVLAWLLNPHENHRLGHRFAEYLLAELAGGQKFHLEESEEAMAQTEKERIDVFYANPASKQVIAIEVKQYSDESFRPNNPGRSQLDDYNEYLEKNYAKKGYHLNQIFLTPMGDKSKSETAVKIWHPMSYERLIQILEKLLLDAPCYTAQIIEDFIHDLERTIILMDKGDLKKKIQSEESLDWDSIERLWELLYSSDEPMIEKRKALNKALTDDVIETLSFLSELKTIQDHSVNQNVQYLIRRLFNVYAENSLPLEDPNIFGQEDHHDRVSALNARGKKNFPGYEFIRLSRDKGQGIFIANIDPKTSTRKERVEIYFSGDSQGLIPNDGLQKIYFEGDKENIQRADMERRFVQSFSKDTDHFIEHFDEEAFENLVRELESKVQKFF